MPRLSIQWGSSLLLLVVAVAPGRAPAQAMTDVRPSRPEIAASSTGEAQLTPDRAAVYIGVQTRASTANAAARDNAQRQRAIIDAPARAPGRSPIRSIRSDRFWIPRSRKARIKSIRWISFPPTATPRGTRH